MHLVLLCLPMTLPTAKVVYRTYAEDEVFNDEQIYSTTWRELWQNIESHRWNGPKLEILFEVGAHSGPASPEVIKACGWADLQQRMNTTLSRGSYMVDVAFRHVQLVK